MSNKKDVSSQASKQASKQSMLLQEMKEFFSDTGNTIYYFM